MIAMPEAAELVSDAIETLAFVAVHTRSGKQQARVRRQRRGLQSVVQRAARATGHTARKAAKAEQRYPSRPNRSHSFGAIGVADDRASQKANHRRPVACKPARQRCAHQPEQHQRSHGERQAVETSSIHLFDNVGITVWGWVL